MHQLNGERTCQHMIRGLPRSGGRREMTKAVKQERLRKHERRERARRRRAKPETQLDLGMPETYG